MSVTDISELLKRISISDDPKLLLIDLKSLIIGLSGNQLNNIISLINCNVIFTCLCSPDKEQVELCVDILKNVLPCVKVENLFQNYRNYVLEGLQHPLKDVKSLVLKQMLSYVKEGDGSAYILSNKDLITAVVLLLSDDDLGIVKESIVLLTELCHNKEALEFMFENEGANILKEVMKNSDSSRFNVYEMAIKVCLLGNNQMLVIFSCGILDKLFREVTGGDILTQLNALEMLIPLVFNSVGLSLLQEKGIIDKLQYLFSLAESDPMAGLLLPGLVKFFGNLGYSQPSLLAEQYSQVLRLIFSMACGMTGFGDHSLQLVAVETLAHIGSTSNGKIILASFNYEMEKYLTHLHERLSSSTSEEKVRVFDALAKLLHIEAEMQTLNLLNVTQSWWIIVEGKLSVERLASFCKQPFADVHCASLQLLAVLANQVWGQRLIIQEPGFIEYILDRSSEQDKPGKEAKWGVVASLVRSQSLKTILNDDAILARLDQYFNQGPFYVHAQHEVAFERES